MEKYYKYYLVALIVILIDQASKLLVYFYMDMGNPGEINVLGEWFRLHYLLNPGMAFGIRWESEYGKLALTLFRLVAMVGIGYYIAQLVKKGAKKGLLICMALILGGAVGNVIDSTFYGVLLDNALPGSPTPWFHGQVIDMLFFPLFEGFFPDWMPFIGGQYFLFFSPVFNIADSSIFIGVLIILIMQKKYFPKHENESLLQDSGEESVEGEKVLSNEAESNSLETFKKNEDKV
ncbi:MAG: lipoprotein signal peptidase [Cyclobacteriaceae bacterium]|nr:lipoprotein signal peptidase [Cyclobacteriaceae bacterium]